MSDLPKDAIHHLDEIKIKTAELTKKLEEHKKATEKGDIAPKIDLGDDIVELTSHIVTYAAIIQKNYMGTAAQSSA